MNIFNALDDRDPQSIRKSIMIAFGISVATYTLQINIPNIGENQAGEIAISYETILRSLLAVYAYLIFHLEMQRPITIANEISGELSKKISEIEKEWAPQIAEAQRELRKFDGQSLNRYCENLSSLAAEISGLRSQIKSELEPLSGLTMLSAQEHRSLTSAHKSISEARKSIPSKVRYISGLSEENRRQENHTYEALLNKTAETCEGAERELSEILNNHKINRPLAFFSPANDVAYPRNETLEKFPDRVSDIIDDIREFQTELPRSILRNFFKVKVDNPEIFSKADKRITLTGCIFGKWIPRLAGLVLLYLAFDPDIPRCWIRADQPCHPRASLPGIDLPHENRSSVIWGVAPLPQRLEPR